MRQLVFSIVTFSGVFQFAAAFLAIRLIRVSGGLVAWVLLSGTFLVMGFRRIVTLVHLWQGRSDADLTAEVLALLISLLAVSGTLMIRPLFSRIKESQENLARVHQQLVESEARYRTIVEFTSDWGFWIAPDNTFKYVSPSCEQISGYAPDDFYRDPQLIIKIMHPDDVPRWERHPYDLQDNGQPKLFDFRITTRDGRERWIAHTCRWIIDADGTLLGRQASNRDITDRKRAEAELRESEQRYRQLNESLERRIALAVDELHQKNQLLLTQSRQAVMGEMLSNIAHQWRQPLNSLGLLAQDLQMTHKMEGLSEGVVESATSSMMNIILHMSTTIDDFRYFFRPSVEKEKFRVAAVLEKSVSLLEPSLGAQNVKTTVEITADAEIEGYPSEFSQVILNLLTNARDAFAGAEVAEPMVTIRLFCEGGRMVVTVADNAGGIPEEIIEKVFDPYFTTKGPKQGTGIGLYMSKNIIEKNMNGSISARNVGAGAEFRIEL